MGRRKGVRQVQVGGRSFFAKDYAVVQHLSAVEIADYIKESVEFLKGAKFPGYKDLFLKKKTLVKVFRIFAPMVDDNGIVQVEVPTHDA
jgi:hypothetical protein